MGAASGVIALLLAALVTLLMRERQAALSRAAASRAALEDSESRWKFAIEGSGDGLWDWDLATGSTYFSARWKALLGYADGEIGAHYEEWSRRVHPQDLAQATQTLEACRAGALPLYVSEYRMACKDGSWKWMLDRGQVVRRDASGAPVRMIGTMSDISGRKRSDEVLQASLRDKEALLKEVHHRVKNNLQVITSLLRLESRRSVLAETRATLSDMQGRIGSMALLHESLYRSGAFASVDLADYLHKVLKEAHDAQMAPGSPVQVLSQLGRVEVGMDQALPCGLMVNELISNALKHGFPAGRAGEVLVVLEPTGDGAAWRLRVGDNGVGLPAGFALGGLSSMGLQLVSQLCQQIGGTLDVQPNPGRGAVFTVVFPVEAPAPLVMPE
jgi:PAS domain S-box-containing protein